jgi:aryl-alcohol dehydrogenase-like predicted oxidoreductase
MVSRIALGCMGFADPARLAPAWTLDEDAAGPIFRQAAELGVTFRDTANVYSSGTSEEIVGRAIKTYMRLPAVRSTGLWSHIARRVPTDLLEQGQQAV